MVINDQLFGGQKEVSDLISSITYHVHVWLLLPDGNERDDIKKCNMHNVT